MATVACAEAASLPVKMLAKLHRHLQSVSLYSILTGGKTVAVDATCPCPLCPSHVHAGTDRRLSAHSVTYP